MGESERETKHKKFRKKGEKVKFLSIPCHISQNKRKKKIGGKNKSNTFKSRSIKIASKRLPSLDFFFG